MSDVALTGPLADAVEEVQVLVSADGARLDVVEAGAGARSLRLRLDLSGVECLDCVLPPEMLAGVVTDSVRRRAGDDSIVVVIDDPRASDAGA